MMCCHGKKFLHEKQTVRHLVKKFPALLELRSWLLKKYPSFVLIPSQLNAIHALSKDFFNSNVHIIPLRMPRCYKKSLSFTFPHQNSIRISRLHHTCHMYRQSCLSPFVHSDNVWWELQLGKPSLCPFLQSGDISSLLGPTMIKMQRTLK